MKQISSLDFLVELLNLDFELLYILIFEFLFRLNIENGIFEPSPYLGKLILFFGHDFYKGANFLLSGIDRCLNHFHGKRVIDVVVIHDVLVMLKSVEPISKEESEYEKTHQVGLFIFGFFRSLF